MLATKDLVIDGVRCAVHDSDPDNREAVVFVHGNPGPMDDWEDLIPAVIPFARAVAMDMPGYGRANIPGSSTSPSTGTPATSADCSASCRWNAPTS